MQQITQPITVVTWYGPTLPLGQAPWKGSTSVVRLVNGTGYSNFVQSNGINSLTQVVTGQVLIVESTAAAIQNGGYALDNGTAPTATANPVRLIASFPAGGTSPAPLTVTLLDQVGTYILDNAFPPAFVTGVTYVKSGFGVVALPITLGQGDTLIITGTTVVGTAGILTLIKQ